MPDGPLSQPGGAQSVAGCLIDVSAAGHHGSDRVMTGHQTRRSPWGRNVRPGACAVG